MNGGGSGRVRFAPAGTLSGERRGIVTTERDKKLDRQETAARILDPALRERGGKSWLGHRGGAGEIDFLLLDGATREEMEQKRGGVKEHLKHLRDEHGLVVREEAGRYQFDREDLGIGAEVNKPAPPRYPGREDLRQVLVRLGRPGNAEVRVSLEEVLRHLAAMNRDWAPGWQDHVRRELGAWVAELSGVQGHSE